MTNPSETVVHTYLSDFAEGASDEDCAAPMREGYVVDDGQITFLPSDGVVQRIADLRRVAASNGERLSDWSLVSSRGAIVDVVTATLHWVSGDGLRTQTVDYIVRNDSKARIVAIASEVS